MYIPYPHVFLPHGKKGTPQAPPEYSDSTQLPSTSHPLTSSPPLQTHNRKKKKKKKEKPVQPPLILFLLAPPPPPSPLSPSPLPSSPFFAPMGGNVSSAPSPAEDPLGFFAASSPQPGASHPHPHHHPQPLPHRHTPAVLLPLSHSGGTRALCGGGGASSSNEWDTVLLGCEEAYWDAKVHVLSRRRIEEAAKLKEEQKLYDARSGGAGAMAAAAAAAAATRDESSAAAAAEAAAAVGGGVEEEDADGGESFSLDDLSDAKNFVSLRELPLPTAPPHCTPVPPTPPPDMAMADLPPWCYSSALARTAVRPATLPRIRPFALAVPRGVAAAFPPKPSLGLTRGDHEMQLAVERFDALSAVGGLAAVRRLVAAFVERTAACGGGCPGAAAAEPLAGWLAARLAAGGGTEASAMHAVTSFAQLALLHSGVSVTTERADRWLECMLEAMYVELPPVGESEAVAVAHQALHQLFHLLSRSLVNDF